MVLSQRQAMGVKQWAFKSFCVNAFGMIGGRSAGHQIL